MPQALPSRQPATRTGRAGDFPWQLETNARCWGGYRLVTVIKTKKQGGAFPALPDVDSLTVGIRNAPKDYFERHDLSTARRRPQFWSLEVQRVGQPHRSFRTIGNWAQVLIWIDFRGPCCCRCWSCSSAG